MVSDPSHLRGRIHGIVGAWVRDHRLWRMSGFQFGDSSCASFADVTMLSPPRHVSGSECVCRADGARMVIGPRADSIESGCVQVSVYLQETIDAAFFVQCGMDCNADRDASFVRVLDGASDSHLVLVSDVVSVLHACTDSSKCEIQVRSPMPKMEVARALARLSLSSIVAVSGRGSFDADVMVVFTDDDGRRYSLDIDRQEGSTPKVFLTQIVQ